jgi:hypothetical protein
LSAIAVALGDRPNGHRAGTARRSRYVDAGDTVTTPIKRRPKAELPGKHKAPTKFTPHCVPPSSETISRIKQWRVSLAPLERGQQVFPG